MSQHRVFRGLRARRVVKTPSKPKTPNGTFTFTHVVFGGENLTYDVYLDYTDLEAMAIKAGGNKSGRCKDGAVTVVVTGRKPEVK